MNNATKEQLLKTIKLQKDKIAELEKIVANQEYHKHDLIESEQRFFDVLHATEDAVLLIDGDTFVECNEAAVQMLKYKSKHDLLKTHPSKLSPPIQLDGRDSNEKANEAIRIAFAEGKYRFEWMHRKANGENLPVEVSLTSVVYKGKQILHCVWHDLTVQKQSEKNLIQKNEQLSFVLQSANIGWCDWEIRAGKETYNEILPKLLGYDYIDMKRTTAWLEDITHPEDLPKVKADLKNHFEGNSEFYINKHRLKAKSGMWKWFFEHGKVIERDKDGKPLRMISTLRDIDKQYRIEKAMQVSENKFRTIFENAPILIDAFDNNGKCLLWNKECEKTFGWTIEEINSTQNTLALFYHDEDEYNRVYESISSKPTGEFREWHPYTKDGRKLVTRWANFEIADGLVINMGYDITHQRKLEVDRKESNDRFKALSEATYEALFLSDKGVCVDANKAACTMFGYSYEEIIGMFGTDFIAIESKGLAKKNMLSGFQEPYDVTAVRKDGTEFAAEIQGRMFEFQGVKLRITALRDITQRKKNEKEIIAAKEKAEESDKLKTAFLQNLSHEIRTPLNGILGFTDLIKMSGLSPDELDDYIKIIEESGIRLINTINDLMDISMLVSGQIDVNYSNVNVRKLITSLLPKFQNKTKEKKISLSFITNGVSDDMMAKIDRQKVNSILSKLITNAIKFTKKGNIEYGCTFISNAEKHVLEFFVKDTGIGIPANRLNSIFDRFTQVDYSTTRGFEGSGLGLSIIKEYVEMLKGTIWVESEEGKGSQFYFKIPC